MNQMTDQLDSGISVPERLNYADQSLRDWNWFASPVSSAVRAKD